MKKLLSLFGVIGLLAFVAMPIYAQEEETVADEVAVEVENVVDEAAEAIDVAVDESVDFVEETSDELADDFDVAVDETAEVIGETVDLDGVDDFNSLFENEEVKAALDEAGLTNEEAAGIFGGIIGLGAGLGVAGIIIIIVWCILAIIAMWKIFTKAGEAGWLAIIPIVNVYIMYKIVGMKNWFWYTILVAFVLGLISGFAGENIAGILSGISALFSAIVGIVAAFKLPRKFGWGVFASILYVLFTGICILILGFGNYKYEGKSEETVVEA